LIEEYLIKNQTINLHPELTRFLVDTYLSESNIKDTGYGPNYNMDSTSLRSIEHFQTYVDRRNKFDSIYEALK
jgi:hypothetical protein